VQRPRRVSGVLCLAALAAATGFAQSAGTLEIRGAVLDPFLGNIGVPGASVTVTEFSVVDNLESRIPVATSATDAQGSFVFHPDHFGRYLIEVHREGYVIVDTTGFADPSAVSKQTGTTLDREHTSQEVPFAMTRPGAVTGRVVDEDGQPVANLHVAVQTKSSANLFGKPIVTDKDGVFTATKLPPGEYFVRPIPKVGAAIEASPFSEAEFKIVDRDFEASFWPGGSAEPQSMVVLGSGGAASVGVIKLKTISYYRVHVSLDTECTPGLSWRLDALSAVPGRTDALIYSPAASFPCMKEILVKNVKPGSYQFAISNQLYGSAARWALMPVQVTRANLEIKVAMSAPSEIRGRIGTVEGAVLPPLGSIKIRNFPALPGLGAEYQTISPDADGNFIFRNLPWPTERIVLSGLSSQYYVKEIRAGEAAFADGIIPLFPGAPQLVEIVVDDQAATLTGTVMDGDKPIGQAAVMLARGQGSTAGQGGVTGKDGTFQIGGLAPGEYRLIAIPSSARTSVLDRDTMNRLLSTAVSVKLERGGSVSLTLKLTDPAR
jgi:uncharacterized surface anchored protein